MIMKFLDNVLDQLQKSEDQVIEQVIIVEKFLWFIVSDCECFYEYIM
jgi:hypothetical protein